ncbi:hypothetical protein FEM48_Zijuj07G0102700 [Ziziphus jujuba var. spinosa]|uniref:Uncharacterized protein n=1 Tax=Ziziphus jujuba var. spinosa TaxID=714518 RepID=A0A978V423_ZIZJJ|nr:hypothetical protein FEM48_Zijuj07G0102700 [Ziziphus jujuba var. spinosa]
MSPNGQLASFMSIYLWYTGIYLTGAIVLTQPATVEDRTSYAFGMMESLDPSYWDFLDYSLIDDSQSANFLWADQSVGEKIDFSVDCGGAPQNKEETGLTRKRGRSDSCSRPGTKACREKLRREKLNDRHAFH